MQLKPLHILAMCARCVPVCAWTEVHMCICFPWLWKVHVYTQCGHKSWLAICPCTHLQKSHERVKNATAIGKMMGDTMAKALAMVKMSMSMPSCRPGREHEINQAQDCGHLQPGWHSQCCKCVDAEAVHLLSVFYSLLRMQHALRFLFHITIT